jgi:hypothetical protein
MKPGDLVQFRAGHNRTYRIINNIGILIDLVAVDPHKIDLYGLPGSVLIDGKIFYHDRITALIEKVENENR